MATDKIIPFAAKITENDNCETVTLKQVEQMEGSEFGGNEIHAEIQPATNGEMRRSATRHSAQF